MNEVCGQQNKKCSCGSKYCVVFALAVFAIVACAYVFVYKERIKLANLLEKTFREALACGEIPEEEIDRLIVPVKELTRDVFWGKVGVFAASGAYSAVNFHPGAVPIGLRSFEIRYVDGSNLSDEEKNKARVTLSRFMYGVVEKKIDAEAYSDLCQDLFEEQARNIKQNVKITAIEFGLAHSVLESFKEKADKAQIEDRMFEIDIAAELRKAINECVADAVKNEEQMVK